MSSIQSLCTRLQQNDPNLLKVEISDYTERSNIDDESLTIVNVESGIDDEARSLAEALQENKTLTSLKFDGIQISDEGVSLLVGALKVNKALTSIYFGGDVFILFFGGNSSIINDKRADLFAGVLRENKSLTSLSFAGGSIKVEGAKALALALEENETLTSINFDRNCIGDEGVGYLAEALKKNKSLTELILSSNGISDTGIGFLVEALKVNKALLRLCLNSNVSHVIERDVFIEVSLITFKGEALLAETLNMNKTLTSLELDDISDVKRKEQIQASITRNQLLARQALCCVEEGKKEELAVLIEGGVSLNGKHSQEYGTLLNLAIVKNQNDIVAFLLKQGANPRIPNLKNPMELKACPVSSWSRVLKKGKEEDFLEEPPKIRFLVKTSVKFETPLELARETDNPTIIALIENALNSETNPIEKAEETITEELLTADIPVRDHSLLEELAQRQEEHEKTTAEELQVLQAQLDKQSESYTQLEQRRQELEKEIANSNNTNDNRMQDLKDTVTLIQAQQAVLLEARAVKEAKKAELERLSNDPNLQEFYLEILNQLESLILSAKAAAGPFQPINPGTLGKTTDKVNTAAELFSPVPVVGEILSKVTKGATAPLRKADQKRQEHIAKQIADLATLTQIQKEIEEIARKLTWCFEPQLKQLSYGQDTPTTAAEESFKLLFKTTKLTNAKKAAQFLCAWIYEAFLQEKITKAAPISKQILNLILQKRPRGIKKGVIATLKEKKDKLTHKLGLETVTTQSGEKWPLRRLFTETGMKTQTASYTAPWTNSSTYGYCLGDEEMCELRGLTKENDLAPSRQTQHHPFPSKQQQTLQTTAEDQRNAEKIDLLSNTQRIKFEQLSKQLEEEKQKRTDLEEKLKEETNQRLEMEKRLKQIQEQMTMLTQNRNTA